MVFYFLYMGDIALKRTTNYSLPTWEKSDFIQMSDFNDLTQKLDAALKSHDTADETALAAVSAEASARAAALAVLAKNLGAAGHNCRIAWGSYTGTGQTGSAHPNTLNFDFYPVLVFVAPVSPEGYTKNPMVLARGRSVATTYPDGASKWELTVSWANSSVSWYSGENDAGYQHNRSGSAYLYVMLGYDKAKEEA